MRIRISLAGGSVKCQGVAARKHVGQYHSPDQCLRVARYLDQRLEGQKLSETDGYNGSDNVLISW